MSHRGVVIAAVLLIAVSCDRNSNDTELPTEVVLESTSTMTVQSTTAAQQRTTTTAPTTSTPSPTQEPSPPQTPMATPTQEPTPSATATTTPSPTATATPVPPTPTPLPFALGDLLPTEGDLGDPLAMLTETAISAEEVIVPEGFIQGVKREYALPPGTATRTSPLTVMTASCYQYASVEAAESALWAEIAAIQYDGSVTLSDVATEQFVDLVIAKEGVPTTGGGTIPTYGLVGLREGPVACLYTGSGAPEGRPLPTLIEIARRAVSDIPAT